MMSPETKLKPGRVPVPTAVPPPKLKPGFVKNPGVTLPKGPTPVVEGAVPKKGELLVVVWAIVAVLLPKGFPDVAGVMLPGAPLLMTGELPNEIGPVLLKGLGPPVVVGAFAVRLLPSSGAGGVEGAGTLLLKRGTLVVDDAVLKSGRLVAVVVGTIFAAASPPKSPPDVAGVMPLNRLGTPAVAVVGAFVTALLVGF